MTSIHARHYLSVLERLFFFAPLPTLEPKSRLPMRQAVGIARLWGPYFTWISDSWLLVRVARWLTVRGGIVILHDGDARGRTTASVLDRLLPQLKKAGYIFGRLEEESPTRR